jgi:hypothetical protein
VDSAKSHIETSGRDGGVKAIAFILQDAESDFADPEIGSPEGDRPYPRRFFHGVRCKTDPFPLLFVSGHSKVFVILQSAVFPPVRAKLMPTPTAFAHQVRIGFGKTAGEEDGSLDPTTVAQVQ